MLLECAALLDGKRKVAAHDLAAQIVLQKDQLALEIDATGLPSDYIASLVDRVVDALVGSPVHVKTRGCDWIELDTGARVRFRCLEEAGVSKESRLGV
jgi:hypothetical protein